MSTALLLNLMIWPGQVTTLAVLAVALTIGAVVRVVIRFSRQPPAAVAPTPPVVEMRERQLLKITSEMLCLHDENGVLLHVSGAVRPILALEPNAVVGLRLDDFVHLDDRLRLLALWSRLSSGGSVPTAEFRFIRGDREIIWVEVRYTRIHDEGAMVRFGSTVRDITRQRHTEAELRQIRDDLSSGLAAGQGTLYRLVQHTNGKWRPIFFSANLERITGFTPTDAMETGWPDNILSLPGRTMRWAAMNEALENGTGTAEYDFPSRSGALIRVRDHFRRWDRSDGTTELVGYIIDTTEAHSNELRLRQAQEEIAAVVTVGPGMLYRMIVRSPTDRRLVYVSGNIETLTGFTPAQMTAPGWADKYIDPAAKISSWKNVSRAIRQGNASITYRYQNKKGEWRWARDTVRHVHGQRRLHELVGYWVDITEERERATQLAQASKLATLGEMATGMAHELSQPLASISMAAENALNMLQKSPSSIEMVGQKLSRISEQAIRAAKLIDHMRIFGRREGGDARPLSLASAVEGSLTIMAGRLRSARVTVTCDIESDAANVMGSIVLVEQVLINLIGNACDATAAADPPIPDDRRAIEITVREKNGSIILIVADHAGGIRDADLTRIFEPFFTTKPLGKGTGLGLSISYGIVTDMGGKMIAYNSADGAVFELSFPKITDLPAASTGHVNERVLHNA